MFADQYFGRRFSLGSAQLQKQFVAEQPNEV